jgi:hypothetical protein
MSSSEKARFDLAIYAKNTGPDGITTEDILKGCEQANDLLTTDFVEMIKDSPFYLKNQQG